MSKLSHRPNLHLPDNIFTLPENHARNVPMYLMFFDTETQQENISYNKKNGEEINGLLHKFRLGCAELWKYDYEINDYNKYKFINTNQFEPFIDFIFTGKTRYERSLWIFCHNLSFDFRVLLPGIPVVYKENIRSFTFDSGKAFVSIKTKRERDGCIHFVDSHNFFHGSIEQLGKIFGIEKKGKDIDFANVSDRELLERCKQDVAILRTGMLFMIRNFVIDQIRMPLTLSSLSFSTYRNFYMKHPIKIYHDEGIREMERQSYHGGRVEIFDKGFLKNIYELDINGMYAYIMKEKMFPIEPVGILPEAKPDVLRNYISKDYALMGDCEISTNQHIPAYPYLHDAKLFFPVGQFNQVLTTPEIEIALNNDELIGAQNVVIYKTAPIFKEFIEEFSKLKEKAKQEKNEIMHLFYKLISNSLYGKWGQRVSEYEKVEEDIFKVEGDLFHEGKLYKIKKLFDDYWIRSDPKDGRYTNTIIASHITAYARCHLWRLLQRASEPVYCDTDAIFIREYELDNYKDVIHKTKLGCLDVELADIEFLAELPKWYRYKYKGEWFYKRKGIPSTATEIGLDSFEFDYFLGFHESYNIFGTPQVVTIKKVKKLVNDYEKRTILPDGKTAPINIKELLAPV